MIAGGVLWSIAYFLIIRQGFKDKTYGMPLAALCANISWEAIFSFVVPHSPPQLYINYAWFALDLVIVFQFLKYGIRQFSSILRNKWLLFYAMFATTLSMAFVAVLSVTYQFSDWDGAYSAFGQNLMMSILFVVLLLNRGSMAGQSVYIAIFKMAGTALTSSAFYLYKPISQGSVLMPFLYVSIFAFDALYLILLLRLTSSHNTT